MTKRSRRVSLAIASIVVLSGGLIQPVEAKDGIKDSGAKVNPMTQNPNTDWMRDGKYGLFFHFLPNINGGAGQFPGKVDEFNVTNFAQDCADAGAAWVIFTLGQNSGLYCSPNTKYNTYSGYAAGTKCSSRDLPMDLYDALNAKGIKLMLYLPCGLPNQDKQAVTNFGGTWNNGGDVKPDSTWAPRWCEVIKEWSDRYGTKVSGWWFDGGWGFTQDQFHDICAAAKSGNTKSIIALNPSIGVRKNSDFEDYTAGEVNAPEMKNYACSNRWIQGLQWHELTFAGNWWGKQSIYNRATTIVTHLNTGVLPNGGALTIDLALDEEYCGDRIWANHLLILNDVKGYVKGGWVNHALYGTATASSVYDAGCPASSVNDGLTSGFSCWASSAKEKTPWVMLDLGSAKNIAKVELLPRIGGADYERNNFEVQASASSEFSSYVTLGSQGSTPYVGTWSSTNLNVNYRYVRMIRTAEAGHIVVCEFRVLGYSSGTPSTTPSRSATSFSANLPSPSRTNAAQPTSR